ncbi:MAG TPA: hypothetical protein VGR06_30970 [Actinophytocola sp.]|jgi:hypothetical protein|uniref:hypothetical protein n=1 Tax=Actinophytocola sp. TaxID=1872138 RepID=UPI002E05CF2C|nr:hypothetical protein [Actinophytocola sp.]
MKGIRSRLRLASRVLVPAMTAAGVLATPAVAAASPPPTCTVRANGGEMAIGSCVDGSPQWSYRFTMYCTLDQTDGTPAFSITTLWTKTTEINEWSCMWYATGYYNNNYTLELRFDG